MSNETGLSMYHVDNNDGVCTQITEARQPLITSGAVKQQGCAGSLVIMEA